MTDYIDRNELRLMRTEECAGHTIEYAMGWKACIDWIKSLPAANVQEVVRCKDCDIMQVCRYAQHLGLDGFCSNGERRGMEMRGGAVDG